MSGFLWIGPQSSNWWQTRDTQLVQTAWNLSISKSAWSPIALSRLSEDIKKWTGYVFYLFAITRRDWEITYFDLSKFCLKVPLNGQQIHTTCFATLLQNELNSDAVRFTTTQCNKVPRAFPLKNGWGGKSKPSRLPWDRQTPSLFNRSWSCIEMGIEVH